MSVMRTALLWASQNAWIERQFRRRRFAKRAVSRFIPGERAEDALAEAAKLATSDISAVVTCLGESVANRAEVDAVVDAYVNVLDKIAESKLDTHVSVKLTHLGLDLGEDVATRSLTRIAEAAGESGSFVWVDIEYSRYVDATLSVFENARMVRPNFGLCLQAYLHRTPQDLERIAGTGAPIRLVKGAYQEPPEVAMASKRDVDHAYEVLALRLIELRQPEALPPGIATHDLPLIGRIQAAAAERGHSRSAYEVQMLFGIERAAQKDFAANGIPVRVLISYGDAWFPWYMRRLAERPANVGFVVRSLFSK